MTHVGIFGGGQLAQMLAQAAIGLGVELAIFERHPDSPAGRLTQREVVGAWDDAATRGRFLAQCNRVTLESEFVDAAILKQAETAGVLVYPTAATLAQVQDKLIQKQTVAAHGVPVPAFRAVASPDDVRAAAAEFGWPLVLKSRRDGYDGYGNATVKSAADTDAAWARLAAKGGQLLVEAWVPFVRELAVMVVRGCDGAMQTYPVVETVQHNHICHIVRAPARVTSDVAEQATAVARKAVAAVEAVGVVGVELFELADGTIVYNEMAPRPHNSGHYTIEGCVTSQFENHLRAVLGWPLGATTLRAPAAVMVNLLGQRHGEARMDGIQAALGVEGAHVHLYGKRTVRPGRKMGHVTALGATTEQAEALASTAAALVEL